jgi:putative acetyltransferase
MFEIREYKSGDEVDIQKIFYDTVHEVNIKDYSQKHVDVWAKKNPAAITRSKPLLGSHKLAVSKR